MRHRGGELVHHGLDLAADQIDQRRPRALVGHVDQLEAALLHQQFEREMIGGAGAGGGHRNPPGPCLGLRHEFAIAGHARLGGSGQHNRHRLDRPDHGQVTRRIVGRVLRCGRCHRDRAGGTQYQGVAVGRPLDHLGGGDHAAATGAILDDHLLAQDVCHRLRDDARGDIDIAARREGHDDAHRLVGEILRRCDAGRHAGRRCQGAHPSLPRLHVRLHNCCDAPAANDPAYA